MKTKFLSIMLLLAAAAGSASATTIQTDRDNFFGAVGSTDLTYDSFDAASVGCTPSFSGYSVAASLGAVCITNQFLTTSAPNGLGSTSPNSGSFFFLASESVTFQFASAITAFAIDINTFGAIDGDYQAVLDTGDTVSSIFDVFDVVGGTGFATGQFIGFTSDTAFSSLTISSNAFSSSPNLTYTLDSLFFGSRSAVEVQVPAPATLLLLGAGLMIGGIARLRRLTTN